MNLKPEYLGKRVSLITSKGKPLDVVLDEKTKKTHLKEIALKWPNWIEKETVKDAKKEPKKEPQPAPETPNEEEE